MEDGTLRRTLATSTQGATPQPLPEAARSRCPQFAASASNLRAAVESVGQAYAHVLDVLMYGEDACTTPAQCFSSAVEEAESLEHFHVFQGQTMQSTTTTSATASAAAGVEGDGSNILHMHSDIGLFLVMTPAQYFTLGRDGDAAPVAVSGSQLPDLQVALRDGSVVGLQFPADALLVMNGEGLTRWMRPSAAGRVQPWSPMHEVSTIIHIATLVVSDVKSILLLLLISIACVVCLSSQCACVVPPCAHGLCLHVCMLLPGAEQLHGRACACVVRSHVLPSPPRHAASHNLRLRPPHHDLPRLPQADVQRIQGGSHTQGLRHRMLTDSPSPGG